MQALQADPGSRDALAGLASLLINVRRDVDGAEDLYRRLLELHPADAAAHSNYAYLLGAPP